MIKKENKIFRKMFIVTEYAALITEFKWQLAIFGSKFKKRESLKK